MRRNDREVTDRREIASILDEAMVCRIALVTDDAPYVVPLSFGYSWDESLVLYFHGADQGRKHDLIRRSNRAGFELDIALELTQTNDPCTWGMKYRSVVGAGRMDLIEDGEQKTKALDAIMKHYGYAGDPSYRSGALAVTTVYRLLVTEMSAKRIE